MEDERDCRNSSEIQEVDKLLTLSKMFGEIPGNFHQNQHKIRWNLLRRVNFTDNETFDEQLLRSSVRSGAKTCI